VDKPACYGQQHASAFQEATVAEAYAYRPPYPPAVFDVLSELLLPQSQRILDVGCGTGALARHLAQFDVSVDTVDVSAAMVARGRQLPNGTHPSIHWHIGPIETATLTPPYALITAGESLHWMEWNSVLPRFAGLLAPNGYLVILELGHTPMPWSRQLGQLIAQYSTNRDYQAVDLIAELTIRGLFAEQGRTATEPWIFRQSIDDYVESFHGRASFSRERMSLADAHAFDIAVKTLLSQHTHDRVELPIVATLVWGKPLDTTVSAHRAIK
jgi:2-polyprenyl-3-methyl-5-hydroxy-6-metoxy-1,4-benzoquinol methylase